MFVIGWIALVLSLALALGVGVVMLRTSTPGLEVSPESSAWVLSSVLRRQYCGAIAGVAVAVGASALQVGSAKAYTLGALCVPGGVLAGQRLLVMRAGRGVASLRTRRALDYLPRVPTIGVGLFTVLLLVTQVLLPLFPGDDALLHSDLTCSQRSINPRGIYPSPTALWLVCALAAAGWALHLVAQAPIPSVESADDLLDILVRRRSASVVVAAVGMLVLVQVLLRAPTMAPATCATAAGVAADVAFAVAVPGGAALAGWCFETLARPLRIRACRPATGESPAGLR